MFPKIAGRNLQAPRRPMMRVTGDAQRSLPANLPQDVLGRLISADVVREVERNDVGIAGITSRS